MRLRLEGTGNYRPIGNVLLQTPGLESLWESKNTDDVTWIIHAFFIMIYVECSSNKRKYTTILWGIREDRMDWIDFDCGPCPCHTLPGAKDQLKSDICHEQNLNHTFSGDWNTNTACFCCLHAFICPSVLCTSAPLNPGQVSCSFLIGCTCARVFAVRKRA